MKAKELMIGDWIYSHTFNGLQPRNIRRINPENIEEYEPIPLTPDILEKNGFVKAWNTYRHSLKKWLVLYKKEFGLSLHIGEAEFRLDYVHELQHIMRLCGIDKEITL